VINVGILFNSRANLFSKYLEWIIKKNKENKDFNLVSIHTNDKKTYQDLQEKGLPIEKSLMKIIKSSDIIFSLGYWRILKKETIEQVPLGIINFHNSYNLKYKGRNCSTYVIKNKENFHGSTMHFIDENIDEGKIIATRKFPISRYATSEEIFVQATNLGLNLLKENFYNILNKEETSLKIPKNKKTYTYRGSDLNHEIDKKNLNNEKDLLREIRSLTFNKKPSPYIILDGIKVYLKMEKYDSGILNKN
jgi:methionyl-tRNA formyltransferase